MPNENSKPSKKKDGGKRRGRTDSSSIAERRASLVSVRKHAAPMSQRGAPSPARRKTLRRVRVHPIDLDILVQATLAAWTDIFESSFGSKRFKIGKDFKPKPQIMGFLLHALIPLELESRCAGAYRCDAAGHDKDLVCIEDNQFSIEIKTSSHPTSVFGNRSYAQTPASGRRVKDRSGYLLAVNFEKFSDSAAPSIRKIRFGWVDGADWVGQVAQSGQQAHLTTEAEREKLIQLFPVREI
ncbi:MAG TPA: ScaI family restriction endonuclease [Candidatus Binatia bacterium]|nr:ScaI family restriction endonuclease [Candidatus Binatia bacterium]